MRERRIHSTRLALCVVAAVFAACGVAASPALATRAEREQAEFLAFANCPFGASPELDCSWASSTYKEMWPSKKRKEEWETQRERKAEELPSQFTAGNVTVPLRSTITLRGGIGLTEEEGTTKETWFGAEGAATIEPVPQAARPLTKDVNTALLSPTELNRYNYYTKVSKETKVTATVELAGPASAIQVSVINLLEETGTAFAFPVKLKLSNPFFGSSCYVGSNSSPIVVEFTTGTSGSLRGKNGSALEGAPNGIITVYTDTLVNATFASPGVEGCGVGGGADAAINAALGLPSPSGDNASVLNGTLKLASAEDAKEGLEGKI